MSEGRKPVIAVIGGSAPEPDELVHAEEVGRLLAEAGVVLVCGGLGGVMEAACRGAKSAGGLTIGILPGVDRNQANRYVDIVLPTGMGYARNVLVAYSGQAVIAVGGSSGTLSEMCFATFLGIPVISLGSWSMSERTIQMGRPPKMVHTPAEAVRAALEAIRQR